MRVVSVLVVSVGAGVGVWGLVAVVGRAVVSLVTSVTWTGAGSSVLAGVVLVGAGTGVVAAGVLTTGVTEGLGVRGL